MAVDSFVLIITAFLFLYFGYLKGDYATLLFASITFFLSGLNIVVNGFIGIPLVYSNSLGILFIGYGTYIGFRSGVELVKNVFNQKGGKIKDGREKRS